MTTRRSLPAVLFAALLLVGACGDDRGEVTTTAPTTTAAPTTTSSTTTSTSAPTTTSTTLPVSQMCQVAGTGGIDDGSVHELVWGGLALARDRFAVEILFRASDAAGYRSSIDSFVAEGCDLIVTVGAAAEEATAAAACDFPEQLFAIVGAAPAAGTGSPWADAGGALRCDYSNVRGITFATEEAAFLAGYLAAGMSGSGTVGTFGSTDLPAVTALMAAFAAGASHFGEVSGSRVQVLGWDPDEPAAALYTGLDDPEQAGVLVETLASAGVDVVFSVAGELGRAGAAVAAERNLLVIGGGMDPFLAEPDLAGVWLTSLEERADEAVLDTVANVVGRGEVGEAYVGTLANGGVGLAPYRLLEVEVPVDLADAVDQLAAEIAAAGGLAGFLAPDEG